MKKLLAMLLTGCLAFGAAACGESAMTEDAPPKTEAEIKTEIIQEIIDDMTPAEKAGQLLMADFRQNADGTGMTTLSEEAKEALAEYHMGGVILFAENLDTTEQTQQLTADLQAAADLGSGLAKNGAIIVSGLADGLDSAGHRAAVKENCPTIGVLGVPIDRTYPASNRELRKKIEQKGCVISEYPPESGPVGPNGFLQRNRLIAALSSALVVVEAQEKSGTMSTVNHAERYGKPVFVVPGSIYSPNSAGTNALLREGRAKAVCKPGDLFGVLGLRGAATPAAVRSAPDPMSETERRVLACIGPKAKGVEELGAASGLPTGLLLGTLMKLELAGRVTCLPGKRYILR